MAEGSVLLCDDLISAYPTPNLCAERCIRHLKLNGAYSPSHVLYTSLVLRVSLGGLAVEVMVVLMLVPQVPDKTSPL